MATRPDVVVFDVNETLTDMSRLRDRFEQVGASPDLLDTWFAATLRDGFALTAAGGYADFADIARAVLTGLLQLRQPNVSGADPAEAASHILAGLPELDVHPDVPAGMRMLHGAGIRLIALTNGSTEMSAGAFSRAGVLDMFEQRLSVSTPARWKPAREAYLFAAASVRVPPERMALVATHPWDVDGAARAGLAGAWLNRAGAGYPPVFTPPQFTGATLTELAGALLALP
jgi:2-haloacid dehalogenase